MTTKSTVTATTPTDIEELNFPEFAPNCIPVEGVPFIGQYVRVLRGPEFDFSGKITRPFIVEFFAVEGQCRLTPDGDIVRMVKGSIYSLWLFHTVIVEAFKEARPKKGERFAVKYRGVKLTKDAKKAGRDGTKSGDSYEDYGFVMPDREVVVVEASCDDEA
jgi:hypothetical protein